MLIDFVSDLRAPTPTGAAEFAVPVKSELEARLLTLQSRLFSAGGRYLQERRSLLDGLKRGSPTWNKFFLKTCKSWTTGANACGSVLKITWKTGKTGLI